MRQALHYAAYVINHVKLITQIVHLVIQIYLGNYIIIIISVMMVNIIIMRLVLIVLYNI